MGAPEKEYINYNFNSVAKIWVSDVQEGVISLPVKFILTNSQFWLRYSLLKNV